MDSKFWSIFTPGPILENLGGHLPIGDIISLSRTCNGLSGLYQELLSRQWDVDVLLKRFFDRPKSFRLQLGLSEALIAGSFALEFFERGSWQAPNLDIVVVEGAGADVMRGCLVLSENYICDLEPDISQAFYFKHVASVQCFSRVKNGLKRRIYMYILSNASFPIRSILEGFWTTSVINFLSWRMAYSLFPSPTFLNHNCYLLQRPYHGWELPIQKYADRGFHFNLAIPVPPDDSRSRTSMRKARKIADRLSWKIPLNTSDMDVPDALDPVRPGADDHVSISEIITGIDQETMERFESMETCKMSGHFVTHYDVKYMRYCGFLY